MSQSRVFALNPCHIGLTNDVLTFGDVTGVDLPAIRKVEIAMPHMDHCPSRFKGLHTAVTGDPPEDAGTEVIDSCPKPEFVFCPDKGLEFVQFCYFRHPF